jgi:hypothetical protein
MRALKRILGWMLGGALLGLLIASFSVSHYLPWYNQPGQGEQTLCDMGTVTRRIAATIYHWQGIGAAVGAGVGLIIAVLLIVRARGRASAQTPPAV